MKKRIKEQKERAKDDEDDLIHALAMFSLAKDDPNIWDDSQAKQFLKEDVDAGSKQHTMKPAALRQSNDAYLKFDKDTFRDHIYQEERARRETHYWLVKKRKKQLKRQGKEWDDGLELDDPVLRM